MNINTINPSIISPQEELEEIIREYITPDKLRKITGINNLDEIKSIELKVDSRKTSIGNVGKILPNLSQLKLNNSYFDSIRNLGSSFDKLNVLWACNCSINELDGISSFNSLKKLYVNKNLISDLYSVTMLDDLETLNIEGNMIAEVEQLEYLGLCSSLNNLTIRNNPITSKLKMIIDESESISKQNKLNAYNQIIHGLVSSITILDGIPLDMKKINILTDDEIKNILKKANELTIDITNHKSKINSNKYYEMENEAEEASELTFGASETVCGNPALFLRSRKQELKQTNVKEKKEKEIKINNYVEEKENDNKNNISDLKIEIYNDKKNIDSIAEDEIGLEKIQKGNKKKLKLKRTTKKKRKSVITPNIPDSENITESYDKHSNIIDNNGIEINPNITEPDKIIDRLMKKDRKLKHRRSQSSIATSFRSTSSMNSSVSSTSYIKSLKSKNNQPMLSVESIYSVSSSECSSISTSRPHSKLRLHRRSSTTESGLDINQLSNSSIKYHDDFSYSNEPIRKLNPLKNDYNKIGLTPNDLNELSKQNSRNVYIRKLNFKCRTPGNNNELNDLSFINNKKDNKLIPHPPLNPIPAQDDSRPISVPIIRRRIYKKKIN